MHFSNLPFKPEFIQNEYEYAYLKEFKKRDFIPLLPEELKDININRENSFIYNAQTFQVLNVYRFPQVDQYNFFNSIKILRDLWKNVLYQIVIVNGKDPYLNPYFYLEDKALIKDHVVIGNIPKAIRVKLIKVNQLCHNKITNPHYDSVCIIGHCGRETTAKQILAAQKGNEMIHIENFSKRLEKSPLNIYL